MSWLYRVLAIAALIGLLALGYRAWSVHQQDIGEARATVRYNAAITQQKLDAGQLLAIETQKANAATKALDDSKVQREIDDAQNARTAGALADQLRAAAGAAGRLRDPNASAAGRGSGGAGTQTADPARAGGGAADAAETGGLLSKQLTEFLLSQAASADEINVAYISCRADALHLREVLK